MDLFTDLCGESALNSLDVKHEDFRYLLTNSKTSINPKSQNYSLNFIGPQILQKTNLQALVQIQIVVAKTFQTIYSLNMMPRYS
ncbi:MAG: hypothetical protein ACK518_04030 [bacterium]